MLNDPSLTCSEGEEEALGGAPLQQGGDTLCHSLVALVDELLAEVAVDLQCRDSVVRWQGAVDKVRELREAREEEERGGREREI